MPTSDEAEREPFDLQTESDRLALAVSIIAGVDLAGIIEAVQHADALGPFVDPTAYRDMLYRPGNMHDAAALARHALPLVEAFLELRGRLEPQETS